MRTLTLLIAILVLTISGCAARQNPAVDDTSREQNAAPVEPAEAEDVGRLDVSPCGLSPSIVEQNMIGLLFLHFDGVDSDGPIYFPRRLYADFGNATNPEISERMAYQLEFLADELATNPQHRVMIIVFDESANNILLAIERSLVVEDFLVQHGVSRAQIIMPGEMDAQDTAPNNQTAPQMDTI